MRLGIDVAILRDFPVFRRLLIGGSLSGLGGQLGVFATVLLVYERTGSSLAVGSIGLAYALPGVATSLIAGSIVDSADRRALAIRLATTQTALTAILVVVVFQTTSAVWPLYIITAAQSAVASIASPNRRTFLRSVLGVENVGTGASLNMLVGHATVIGGPLLAGAVSASVGVEFCFVLDLGLAAGAFYGLLALPKMPPKGAIRGESMRESILEGFRYVRDRSHLRAALLLDLNATVFAMPLALLPEINERNFGGSAFSLGALNSALSVGGVIGASLLASYLNGADRPGRVMVLMGLGWCLCTATFAFVTFLPGALAILAVAGICDVASVILRTRVVQIMTSDQMLGRVSSVEFMIGSAAPQLGNFRAGLIASLLSAPASALIGGTVAAIGVGAVVLKNRSVLDELDPPVN